MQEIILRKQVDSSVRPLSIGGSFAIGAALDCKEGCPREEEHFTGEFDEVRYNGIKYGHRVSFPISFISIPSSHCY